MTLVLALIACSCWTGAEADGDPEAMARGLASDLESRRFDEVAKEMAYPINLTASERRAEESGIAETLELLSEAFGILSIERREADELPTYDIGVSAGSVSDFGKEFDREFTASFPAQFSRGLTGVVEMRLVEVGGYWKCRSISFGVAKAQAAAREFVAEIAEKVVATQTSTDSPTIDEYLRDDLQE